MNSFDDLTPECLGQAGLVYEHVLVSRVAQRNGKYATWDITSDTHAQHSWV